MFGKCYLLPGNFELQILGDLTRHLALRREQFGSLALVSLPPKQLIVAPIEQLHADSQAVATLRDPTRKHRAHSEFVTDFDGIDLFAFITKHRTGGTDFEVRQL